MRFIAFLFLVFSPFAAADEVSEVRAFFEEFVELGKSFDAEVAELYSPDARIMTLRDGTDRIEVTGSQWREMIRKMMPVAERRGDTSSYSNVQMNAHGEGFRVSALRSSAIKCVDDSDYYLDVEREGDQWVIVEEYSETVSLSRCEPSKELAESLSEVRETMRPHLPLDLDADTRLESVEVVGSALIYNQRLHTVAASEVSQDKAEAILKQIGVQNACGTAEVAALIRDGATVRYATVGRHGERLATVDISPGLCSVFAQ